jgi:urease accessory protein
VKQKAPIALNSQPVQGWQARLDLGFAQQHGKTVLAQRSHIGPLTVQRPFYPEGEVCHVYVLHPPGGVVAGDSLSINLTAASASAALVTTPAAGKFYRSNGAQAKQQVQATVATGGSLEWLPQESIMYEGAQVNTGLSLDLAIGARFMGWEIMAFGRPAAGEGFADGQVFMNWQIRRDGELFYKERLKIDALAFAANWGLKGQSACGTLLAYPATGQQLSLVQEFIGERAGLGVTLLDDLLVCRGLDSRADRLRDYFQQLWQLLRPTVILRKACSPRIWST